MAHPAKFTDTEREAVMARVEYLDKRGYEQTEIAKEIGVTQPMVSNYLRKIRQRYIESQLHNREEWVASEIARIKHIQKEAFEAWEASKGDKHKIINESVTSDFGEKITLGEVKERQTGNSTYLSIVLDCVKQIRELKGLDAPKKVHATVETLDWTPLVTGGALTSQRDEVEEAIAQAMLGHTTAHVNGQTKEVDDVGDTEYIDEAMGEGSDELDGSEEPSEEV